MYGCEIVIRPDTIIYLACSLLDTFKNNLDLLKSAIDRDFDQIVDWSDSQAIILYIPKIINIIDSIVLSSLDLQKPLLMQPIWKTEGKSPKLSEHCLDVFIWSNLAFTRLFIDLAKAEIDLYG